MTFFSEFVGAMQKEIPVARPGQPEDVAAAVSYVCREDAGFVSGQRAAAGPFGTTVAHGYLTLALYVLGS